MSVLVTSAAKRARSATGVNPIGRVSAIDAWIGSRVRIKRTSLGISEQEFSTSLSIGRGHLPRVKQARSINPNLLFRIARVSVLVKWVLAPNSYWP